MGLYFLFFFISGFCGILYELIWLRLAMAKFGVTTPLVSTVLAMFMAGLGAGSWIAGRALRRHGNKIKFPPLRLYAVSEFLIGLSAFLVPLQLHWEHQLMQSVTNVSISSTAYYLACGILIALTIVPWCAAMGATIPLAMFAIRSAARFEARRSFSFLYISNVFGALVGTFVPLLLIEQRGFQRTLLVGALLNFTIAIASWTITLVPRRQLFSSVSNPGSEHITSLHRSRGILLLLFLTGLTTMGMELVWIRMFTPYVGVLVYSFAAILFSYLFGTFVGCCFYRDASKNANPQNRAVWILLPLFGALPLLLADPRLPFVIVFRPFVGIAPFAAVVGYLTPMLVDRWAAGDPDRAGRAYAINVLGCIAGPLISGFILLPVAGEKLSMLVFVLPWFIIAAPWRRFADKRFLALGYACLATAVALIVFTRDYGDVLGNRVVLRDSTATVTATGSGKNKWLLINGIGMTRLQPTTKMMAHLTLASLEQTPRSVLVICFGMGTTFRSAISWNVPTTAVELVPSVPKLFSFYHEDANKVLASPLSQVVIDDGRRYLERSKQRYDVIIIDPPPPVSAAGSSLLYSEEFYKLAQQHLSEGAILQQWLPDGDNEEQASVARALSNAFPYVRVFPGLESAGWHFLASMRPIPIRTSKELVDHMPPLAVEDMMEWGPANSPEGQFQLLLSREFAPSQMMNLAPETPALSDDRPVNEYFLLRSPLFKTSGPKQAQTKSDPSGRYSPSE